MRVCLITENYDPSYGGQYTAIQNVARICKFSKISHFIIHKKSRLYKNKFLLEKNINDCDIIHLFGGWTFFYFNIYKLSKKLRKKIIIHTMGLFDPQSFKQKRLKKEIAWKLYQKRMLLDTDLIHCGSDLEEQNLKKLSKKFNTVVLPFSINKSDTKKNFSKKLNRKCIFFSRLHNQKGLDKLIKAWLTINNKNWKLDIFGFGNSNYYIKKFKLNKNNNIRFLNPVINERKKFKLFDNYDFLVLPSSGESFGLAILEALTRRIPVLTTNMTPWQDIQIKNCGWIINDSIIELKLVLNQIFNSSKNELLFKKKNTIKIVKNFYTHHVSKLYLKLYLQLYKS